MRLIILLFCLSTLTNCDANNIITDINSNSTNINNDTTSITSDSIKHYLALGDSYTIAQSVASNRSFPAQLRDCLIETPKIDLELEIIAATGWTTGDLIAAIEKGPKRATYNLVTLLIGVNNQYQGKPFTVYKREFTDLLEQSIKLANNNKNNVVVVSIPDYAYTPFGQNSNPKKISKEIDKYNTYAEATANTFGVTFVNITDITREGLKDPELVANDNLHPSGKAYKKFAEKICPTASSILK
ncbi:SGNH/GDSL hydrolase family protein [Aureibaculum conchae]|uniref:SGNH/GDSL hydrolase family protein n=1 Tax=Aureibaculum sp. 2308TA14-22 TaxID=3108392 RepID=UPI003393755A